MYYKLVCLRTTLAVFNDFGFPFLFASQFSSVTQTTDLETPWTAARQGISLFITALELAQLNVH